MILINKDRILHSDHVPQDRLPIHVHDLLYPHQDSIIDLNIVITMLLLLALPQIRMISVQQRKKIRRTKEEIINRISNQINSRNIQRQSKQR